MTTIGQAAPQPEETSTIHPGSLLRQLDSLWAEFGKGSEQATEGGVVRACSLTWVTVVEGDDRSVQEVDEMLAEVMRVHPSRAIVVLLREGQGRSLKGSVSAQCWRPFGSKQQVCIERVLLEGTRDSACDVPAVIRALLVADLPVVLFCRNARLLQLEGIAETSKMADRVVVDIAYRGTECLDIWPNLPNLGRYVSDLAWDRIIGFRRALASHFQLPAHRGFLSEFTKLTVSTRAKRPTPEAAYLLSWILNSMGFVRSKAGWSRGAQHVVAGFVANGTSAAPVFAVEFSSAARKLRFQAGARNGSNGGLTIISLGDAPDDAALLSDEMVVEYRRRTFEQFLPETIQLFEEPDYLAHQ